MLTKADFTAAEWVVLRAMLDAMLFKVALADQVLGDQEATAGSELAESAPMLFQELLKRGEDPRVDEAVLQKAVDEDLDSLLPQALSILKAKSSPAEMQEVCAVLRKLAQGVAEADNDVAACESQLLDSLDEMLGNIGSV